MTRIRCTATLALLCLVRALNRHKDNDLATRLRELANGYDTRPREVP